MGDTFQQIARTREEGTTAGDAECYQALTVDKLGLGVLDLDILDAEVNAPHFLNYLGGADAGRIAPAGQDANLGHGLTRGSILRFGQELHGPFRVEGIGLEVGVKALI